MIKLFSIFLFFSLTIYTYGQANRFGVLEGQLDSFALVYPELNETAEIDISSTIKDLVSVLASNHEINITIDPSLNQPITTTLPNVIVKDLLLYLCKQYNLDLDFTGSIITVVPNKTPPPLKPYTAPVVNYQDFNKRITIQVKQDTLSKILALISEQTGVNIVPTTDIRQQLISININKAALTDALEQLAFANNMELKRENDEFYTLASQLKNNTPQPPRPNPNVQTSFSETLSFEVSNDTIRSLTVVNIPIKEIIRQLSNRLGVNYFLFAEPEETLSINLNNVSYDQFLTFALQGTKYTYRVENEVYLIGENSKEGLRTTRFIQLQHRSFQDVLQTIPEEITASGVTLDTFPELNTVILSGSPEVVRETEQFIMTIDRSVPNVSIELIILDVQKNNLLDAGIEAGINPEIATGGGKLFPDFEFNFSAGAINNLLNILSGQGIVNLGPVSPDFYLSLKAVEENGLVEINSRPILSTLNAHPAQFITGETRYYQEQRFSFQPGINPIQTNELTFNELKADFKVEILPIVSGDEQVTMTISVDQKDFIGEPQINAPSPQVTREFNSMIRVKNGEMVVLGGLVRKQKTDNGRGVPFLSRIPIIKWFFSNRRKNNSESQLLIFVKPTIIF